MPTNGRKTTRAKQTRAAVPGRVALERLLEEATVDCYDEEEEATALFTVLEDHLELPFEARVLGEAVTVEGLRLGRRLRIEASCQKGAHRQRFDLLDLELSSPPPIGAEWIRAYEYWAETL